MGKQPPNPVDYGYQEAIGHMEHAIFIAMDLKSRVNPKDLERLAERALLLSPGIPLYRGRK